MDFASYISGFADGEGCFSVSFTLRAKLRTGIEVRPSFSVGQNERSLELLQDMKEYFKCGGIRFSKRDRCYKFEVRDVGDLCRYVIPHFERYPLRSAKARDFERFRNICLDIHASKHLNPDHLKKIVSEAYRMNGSGKRKYTEAELLRMLG